MVQNIHDMVPIEHKTLVAGSTRLIENGKVPIRGHRHVTEASVTGQCNITSQPLPKYRPLALTYCSSGVHGHCYCVFLLCGGRGTINPCNNQRWPKHHELYFFRQRCL